MEPPKRKRLKPGERVALSLTLEQANLIAEPTFIGEKLLAILYAAKVRDDVVRVRCTLDDLDQFSKYVAAEANNTKDKKLQQKLDAIFDAIRTLEQSYYGAPLRLVTSGLRAKRTELDGE